MNWSKSFGLAGERYRKQCMLIFTLHNPIFDTFNLKVSSKIKAQNLQFENELLAKGVRHFAGIDEVGRGPLAGPVVAAAVVFPPDYYNNEITDSKKISALKREILAVEIESNAVTWAVASATVGEIDIVNIRQATFLAMRRAVAKLAPQPQFLLVDGDAMPDIIIPGSHVVKGDERSFTIAAASILAKVARDRYMKKLHEEFPEYGFDSNKGYGTNQHILALKKFGATVHHRKLFLRKILGEKNESPVAAG